ncbi:MAG: DUF3794 domain-containing protein, partial [Clostridia bacterium]|nr:DUF3794 domain-containing protein [Clostridia bacterium]
MSDMKQQKNKSEDTVCALLYDGDAQTETGCEYTLPDYLPDIRKILRVQAEPRVTGRYLSGEKAELEGTVSASVVYMAEDGTLHICPIENTFGQNIPISGLDENTTAIFHTRVDNNTCRLTGPRKLNLRHKLKTQVHVFTKCSSHPDLSEIPAAERDRVCLDLKARETCRMLCPEP